LIGAPRVILVCGLLLGAALPPAAAAPPGEPIAESAIERFAAAQAIAAATRGEIHLVDVRPAAQRSLGHIRGDLHIPLDQLRSRHGELPRDRTVIFYCSCRAEETALEAARIVMAAGDARAGVLVGGYDAWRAAGGQFQVDATWEEIFRPDLPPVAWGKLPADTTRCRYAKDGKVAFRGRASGRIGCWRAPARGFAGLQQRIDARGIAGRLVTLSAMVQVEEVQPGAFLWVAAESEDGKVTAMGRSEPDSIRGSRAWRPVELEWTVPPGAARVVIGASLMGVGGLWLDEVRFTVSQEKGPSRAVPVRNAGFED
jgi:rhodanese-related sulfurtransferase